MYIVCSLSVSLPRLANKDVHISPMLQMCHPSRLRSTFSNQLAVQFSLSTVSKGAFLVSGINFWNSLPPYDICSNCHSRYSDSILKHFSLACHIWTSPSDLLSALFNCGPNDNSCYLGLTKNPDNDDDDNDNELIHHRHLMFSCG